MSVLTQAAWPGNVRELENTIERLVVLGREAVVTVVELAFLQGKPPDATEPFAVDAPAALRRMNRSYLQWVLARTQGDKPRAAKILNVNLSTLYRWERASR
jgi:two-component system, NtrC family, response regulator HydG